MRFILENKTILGIYNEMTFNTEYTKFAQYFEAWGSEHISKAIYKQKKIRCGDSVKKLSLIDLESMNNEVISS